MHARLLDMLHHGADVGLRPIRHGVDVDLERALDEAVDQHGPVDLPEVLRGIADAHRTPTEHIRGPDEHGITDPLRDDAGLRRRSGDPPRRAANSQ
jgi:hypothetical protein